MGLGSSCSCGNAALRLQVDIETIRVYLEEHGDLAAVWDRFDADHGGEIDHAEFERILVACFQFFILRMDPNEAMSRTELQPFINTLNSDLHKMIDPNGDGVLSFEEFQAFGQYLRAEYRKLQAYMRTAMPHSDKMGLLMGAPMPTTTSDSEPMTPIIGGLSIADAAGVRPTLDEITSGKVTSTFETHHFDDTKVAMTPMKAEDGGGHKKHGRQRHAKGSSGRPVAGDKLPSERPGKYGPLKSTSEVSQVKSVGILKRIKTPVKALEVGGQMQVSDFLVSKPLSITTRSDTWAEELDVDADDELDSVSDDMETADDCYAIDVEDDDSAEMDLDTPKRRKKRAAKKRQETKSKKKSGAKFKSSPKTDSGWRKKPGKTTTPLKLSSGSRASKKGRQEADDSHKRSRSLPRAGKTSAAKKKSADLSMAKKTTSQKPKSTRSARDRSPSPGRMPMEVRRSKTKSTRSARDSPTPGRSSMEFGTMAAGKKRKKKKGPLVWGSAVEMTDLFEFGGSGLRLENNMCSAKDELRGNSALGHFCIGERVKVEWELRVVEGTTPTLGVLKATDEEMERCKTKFKKLLNGCFGNDANGYGYQARDGGLIHAGKFKKKYGETYQMGDRITVTLDLLSKTLSFSKNGESQGVAYKNVPAGDYRLAIFLPRKRHRIFMKAVRVFEVAD